MSRSASPSPMTSPRSQRLPRTTLACFAGRSLHRGSSVDESRGASTTLTETNSFNDVAKTQDGRTFDILVRPGNNVLDELRQKIAHLSASRSLDATAAQALQSAVDAFGSSFDQAIVAIADDPGPGFASEQVDAQAEAFGALCRASRVHATSERARLEIRPLVAQLGIVPSDGSEPMAIVAAWHPFSPRGATCQGP